MRAAALAAVVVLVAVRWWDPVGIQVARHKVFDLYQRVDPTPVPATPVAILDIDEASLAEHGQWPWPRNLVAALIGAAAQAGAASVALDIGFTEPDRTSPARIAESLGAVDEATRAVLATLPDNDAVLAQAVAAAPVVLGQSFVPGAAAADAKPWPRKAAFVAKGPDPKTIVPNVAAWLRNLGPLEEASRGLGGRILVPDPDNEMRRPALLVATGEALYPTLPLEALRVALGQGTIVVLAGPYGLESIRMGPVTIPTDRRGRLWLRALPASAIDTISAAAVLAGEAGALAALKGRIVLVGVSAAGLSQIYATAAGELTSTQIQAGTLATILSNRYLLRPTWTSAAEMASVGLIGLALAFAVPGLGAVWSFLLGGVLIVAYGGLSWFLFQRQGVLLDASFTAGATFLLYTAVVAATYLRERTQRQQVKAAFAQYLAPALVERLADQPESLELGGEMKPMTVMFTDIRGFTGIAERFGNDARGLTRLINLYFTAMTDRLLEYSGSIDKFMGDAIMAFWNAPIDDPEHARHACLAALEMLDGLRKLNRKLAADPAMAALGGAQLDIGIGINTGNCLVGNVGSEHRFNYSVIGDAVNVASRLEGETKTWGLRILVGDGTRRLASDFAFLEVESLRVRGRGGSETVHALLGGPALAADPAFRALAQAHDTFLAAQRRGDADAAAALVACQTAAAAAAEVLGRGDARLDRLYDAYARGLAAQAARARAGGASGGSALATS